MTFLIRAVVILCGVMSLVACQPKGQMDTNKVTKKIIKSPADLRQYRALKLANGLQVMLISDPTADRSAAALDVHVGSGHDPKDREGLAHYLEHMLFLGTEEFPKAGEYQQYISEHGGSNNAYTTLEHTNYFFSISPDYMQGALDRFAQFFIAPLFNPEYLKRERSIVHSEYTTRRKDEGRRLWTARRVTYNPQHPSTKFSVGSNDTLADRENHPVRQDVIDFYQRYYHASRMALAVISSHDLDQLQTWVEERFSAIVSQGEPYQPFTQPLLDKGELPVVLTVKPLKESRSISFSFPIEPVDDFTDSKPVSYLSNLLGHEGEGSLLAALKKRTWANSLSVGMGYADSVHATLDIRIGLSELGFSHLKEIGEMVFATIALVREKGIQQRYYDEVKQLAEINFRFQEKSSESSLVQRLASQLHRFTPEEVLSAPYLYTQFKPERLARILETLQPQNCQVIIVDPDLKSEQKTPWYDVAYTTEPLNPNWLSAWSLAWDKTLQSPEIALPGVNTFVPQNLVLIETKDSQAQIPQQLSTKPKAELWYQNISKFKQPKAELYFSLRTNKANDTPRSAMLTQLYVTAVKQALSKEFYPAYLAGLNYQIYQHSRGLSVRISGYSEKQATLLLSIVDGMKTLQVSQQAFDLYKENLTRQLENVTKGRPSSLASEGIYEIVLSSSWSNEEEQQALKTIDVQALNEHVVTLLHAPELLVLSTGNVDEKTSIGAAKSVEKLIPKAGQAQNVARAKIRKLRRGEWMLKPIIATHDDAAMMMLFQAQNKSIKDLATTQMLSALIGQPFHKALRTEAEIGYIVSGFAYNILDVPALGFVVQSNTHSVEKITNKSLEFLREYKQTLTDLTEEEFASAKAGLITRLEAKEKQLKQVASRYWEELDRMAYQFDTRQRLIEAVKAIDQSNLVKFYEQLVLDQSSAVLLSYSFGSKPTTLNINTKLPTKLAPKLFELRKQLNQFF